MLINPAFTVLLQFIMVCDISWSYTKYYFSKRKRAMSYLFSSTSIFKLSITVKVRIQFRC